MIGKVNTTSGTIAEAKKLGITELSDFVPLIYNEYNFDFHNYLNNQNATIQLVFDDDNNIWFLGQEDYFHFKCNELTYEKTDSEVLKSLQTNYRNATTPIYYNDSIYFFYAKYYEEIKTVKYDTKNDTYSILNDPPLTEGLSDYKEQAIAVQIGNYAYILTNTSKLYRYDFSNDTYLLLNTLKTNYSTLIQGPITYQYNEIYYVRQEEWEKYDIDSNTITDMGQSIFKQYNNIGNKTMYAYKDIMYVNLQQKQNTGDYSDPLAPLISILKFDLKKNEVVGAINISMCSSEGNASNLNFTKVFGKKNKLYALYTMGCRFNTENNKILSYAGTQRFLLLDKGGKSE